MSETNCIIIASSLSGIIEVIVSHPLDRIKTQMQINALDKLNLNLNSNQSNLKQNLRPNTISIIKNIYHDNKIKGFYSGILPRLIGIIPMRLMYWSSMTLCSNYIIHNKTHLDTKFNKYMHSSISNITINLIPGLITGIAQSIIDNPIEVMKIKLMTKTNAIKINNLYQGFGYLLGRNILFAMPVAYLVKTYGKENPFLAGAFGGLIGSIISHPFDVIKTERQRHKSHLTDPSNPSNPSKPTIRKLIIQNPSKLFTGLSMRCGLSFINMGIGFVVFNYINNKLLQI
jgi:hypothetical protein